MRQIVLDTETTGIDPKQGHRLIEIGCIELVNRRLTGNHYHQYVNPQRVVEQEAIDVHGITNEFLVDKPLFSQVVDEFLQFVNGAELIIHNAPFDVGFLNHELRKVGGRGQLDQYCTWLDTLVMARNRFPGQRNSLDALCKRFGVDNSHRELHGALLDSEILADVYLMMTGGQTNLMLGADEQDSGNDDSAVSIRRLATQRPALKVVSASEEELERHSDSLDRVDKASGGSIWRQ